MPDHTSTYDSAARSDLLRNCVKRLATERLFDDLGLDREVMVEDSKLQRAAWIASILANSDDDDHRQLALSFAVLAYHHADDETTGLYRNYLQTVMSRLGNVPVAREYFDDKPAVAGGPSGPDEPEDGVPATLKYELQGTQTHYSVDISEEVDNKTLVLTQFQKRVWDQLAGGDDAAFSGPTSSGKSYLVQQYIQHLIKTGDDPCCLYLVPSRALIAEVSAELLGALPEHIDVRTEVVGMPRSDEAVVYVMTPERTLGLLESDEDLTVDFCFVDEIQSVEKPNRGALFEYVIDAILTEWPTAQVVGAGPFIKGVSSPISDAKQYLNETPADEVNVGEVETTYSPVYRLQSEFTFERWSSQLEVSVADQTETELDLKIDRPNDVTFSKAKRNRIETIRAFAELYREDDPLLVYAQTVSRAKEIAKRIADDRERDESRFPKLVSFLKDELTASYPLIDCLQSGAAYHHGGVPPFARSEIEALYDSGQLDTIVSTTTLLEGVNLPAGKILIVDHNVGGGGNGEPLSSFQLQNLVGRVGRVGKRLHGQVLYVDHEDDRWANEHVGGVTRESIDPVTTQTLGDKPDQVVRLLGKPLHKTSAGRKRSTAVFLKSRYLVNPSQTKRFVRYRLKQSSESDVDRYVKQIISELNKLQERLEVPQTVVESNPSVDPDVQDKIFTAVRDDPSRWVVSDESLEADLLQVVRLLNEAAAFVSEDYDDCGETQIRDINTLTNLTVGWLRERGYEKLVNIGELANMSKLLRALRQDVRYVLSKYFKVLSDTLGYVNTGGTDRSNVEFTRQLHLFLEHGTTVKPSLRLMNLGLSRSVALRLSQIGESVSRSRLRRYAEESSANIDPFVAERLRRHGISE